MRTMLKLKTSALALLSCTLLLLGTQQSRAAEPMREWTFLVFLNGHNNLDSFGAMDLNEMEKVGSSANVNVVVQWASAANKTTKRLYVKKDNDPKNVTSPVLMEMPRQDMGDYRNLVEFARWGMANFPAKHYFINVWNHGSGWHLASQLAAVQAGDTTFSAQDISWDDFSGHHITTEQLGQAMKDISTSLGRKIDLLGMDSCLMGMVEVASEVAESVNFMAASQEVEPGAGWPYDNLLARWNARPSMNPAQVGATLVQEYVASYSGGSQGTDRVTFSLVDLGQIAPLQAALKDLAANLTKASATDKASLMQNMLSTQRFYEDDYRDLYDFISQTYRRTRATNELANAMKTVAAAHKNYAIYNAGTKDYLRAKGVSIWLPVSAVDYKANIQRYKNTKFNQATGWADFISAMYQ